MNKLYLWKTASVSDKRKVKESVKMENIISNSGTPSKPSNRAEIFTQPSYQAYQILRVGFTVAPIVAGLDKFFNLLVNWDQYMPPVVNSLTGGRGHQLMLAVGLIEIVAGLGVWFKPKLFAYVVAAWLLLIITNLLLIPGYYDVALRDFGLALAAVALGRLSEEFSS
jgi:hypothetical protein